MQSLIIINIIIIIIIIKAMQFMFQENLQTSIIVNYQKKTKKY